MVPSPQSVEAELVNLFGRLSELSIGAVLGMKLDACSDLHLRCFELSDRWPAESLALNEESPPQHQDGLWGRSKPTNV